MNSQDEFRELESQLNSLPSKNLTPKSFEEIHHRLLNEAEALDRREKWGSILKKTAMGMAGAAALCLMLFLGFSMGNQSSSDHSEFAKSSDQKNAVGDYGEKGEVERDYFSSESSVKIVVESALGEQTEITDEAEIAKLAEIFREAHWENAKIKKVSSPDYKVNERYLVWLTPQRDRLEIIISGENKHTVLSEEASNGLYEILTGGKLGD
ncbi:hypothetical protein [Bacillus sp. FJAT-27445]|uniref:hypothetical protein n=1 Tax=Bacillus sp. FJAT-27445 TaxID=1679166 RepID=UPI00074345D6|nr:hypothetical protein [Bacillus sp. FJAT-27445]